MNEQTAALIGQLATKLGTTSEYLWMVLVKQAPVQGWIMFVEYLLTIALLIFLYRSRTAINAALNTRDPNVIAIGGVIIGGVVGLIWLIACVFSFESMVTAFLNPEYWALNKVLATVKVK